jgi:DNA-directed RNA polymerase subunit RPC12/RpoP
MEKIIVSHTKEVLIKLQELGPDALNDAELRFAHIIQTIEYCANCKNNIHATDSKGNRVCPICSSTEFVSIDIDLRQFKCSYCGTAPYLNNGGGNLPFANVERKTFYCGCRGWD